MGFSKISNVTLAVSGIFRSGLVGIKTPSITYWENIFLNVIQPIYFRPSITYDVTGISLLCITVHSRSNHYEFNQSCHWLISQFNHLNFTKISHLKKNKKFWEGGKATFPNHSSVASELRRLKSKLSPLSISGYTTAGRGWRTAHIVHCAVWEY